MITFFVVLVISIMIIAAIVSIVKQYKRKGCIGCQNDCSTCGSNLREFLKEREK